MNDSVFTSRNVLNYWTTLDIKNEQIYRITAKQQDGNASQVTVNTPKKLPSVYITTNNVPPRGARIYIDDGVEHIADIQSVWYIILKPGTENRRRLYSFPILNTVSHTFAFYSSFSAFANWEEQLEHIEQSVGNAEVLIMFRQFFVASAGPEWDDNFSTVDDLEYFLDGTASNVENGLGFMVGVEAKWFRQMACLTPDSSNYTPCEPEEPIWY